MDENLILYRENLIEFQSQNQVYKKVIEDQGTKISDLEKAIENKEQNIITLNSKTILLESNLKKLSLENEEKLNLIMNLRKQLDIRNSYDSKADKELIEKEKVIEKLSQDFEYMKIDCLKFKMNLEEKEIELFKLNEELEINKNLITIKDAELENLKSQVKDLMKKDSEIEVKLTEKFTYEKENEVLGLKFKYENELKSLENNYNSSYYTEISRLQKELENKKIII